jgi:hypothetical protein
MSLPSDAGGMRPIMPGMLGGKTPPPTCDKLAPPQDLLLFEETVEQQLEREATVIRLLYEVYDAAVYQVGTRRARELWKQTTKGKAGRPKGPSNPARDDLLLKAYDRYVSGRDGKAKAAVLHELSEKLKRLGSDWFPGTSDSIEHRIRVLLKKRSKTVG